MARSPNPLVAYLRNPLASNTNQVTGVGTTETPIDYYYEATKPSRIARMIGCIRDNGTLTPSKYGKNLTLANGIDIFIDRGDNEIFTLIDNEPIKRNNQWGGLAYDATPFASSGEDYQLIRWSFDRFMKNGLPLSPGDRIVMRIKDDLSSLAEHTFCLEGEYDID